MTKRDNDLDAILEVLMFDVVPLFKEIAKNAYGSEKLNKESLKDTLTKLELEDWIFEKYLDKLEKDGYIEIDNNGFVSITNKGENFKINEGGFRGVTEKQQKEKDRVNKKDWILNFDRKWRIPAAILAVLIFVFSVIKLTGNQNKTIQEDNNQQETQKENIKSKENNNGLMENTDVKKEVDTLNTELKSESKTD